MSNGPLVSIVTPSYNQAAYLEQTLQSVLAQDYASIEYLVVDGASTDNSVDIIRRYADRLAWWISEPDAGQAEAINKGLKRSKGEIVAWLNSDDLYLPGAIAQAVAAFQADPELGMVFGDAITIDAGGKPINKLIFGDWGLEELVRFRIICQPAVFMRRSVLEDTGYLDPSYHLLLDHQLWIRIARIAPTRHISALWAAARHHPEAKNVALAGKFGQETIQILQWMRTQPELTGLIDRENSHILGGVYRLSARYLLDSGQPKVALQEYWRALQAWPSFALKHWHRMLYAILCTAGIQKWTDALRSKSVARHQRKLSFELQRDYFPKISDGASLENWPGLCL
jgi:glycosyltransferase involved in cell wall biosynthesis